MKKILLAVMALGLLVSSVGVCYADYNSYDRYGSKTGSYRQTSSGYNTYDKYDNYQMEAILADTEGIQRIRGMAGSGKTVILARKAVELHTAHPDWNIAVTFSTRSLKNQLERLIGKFYSMKNEGAKYQAGCT